MKANWPFARSGLPAQSAKTLLVALPLLVFTAIFHIADARILLALPVTLVWLWAVNKLSGWIGKTW